jgi:hypothetical protein
MEKVPYRGPRNIRRHRIKFSRPGARDSCTPAVSPDGSMVSE